MQINTDGLVINERTIGESDRLVTLLTRDEGVIRAFASRAKTMKSKQGSATQLLCYSKFSIYHGRDKFMINDAHPLDVFFDLRSNMEKISLAQYFCELVGVLAPEEAEAGDFLRLILNALHFLAKETRPSLLIKAAFEMRLLALAGFMPDLVCCKNCAVYEAETMVFLPKRGIIYCEDCFQPNREQVFTMGRGVLTALRHTIYADFDKLFSFQLNEAGQKQLSQITESYMRHVTERRFMTLDFYHQLEGDCI